MPDYDYSGKDHSTYEPSDYSAHTNPQMRRLRERLGKPEPTQKVGEPIDTERSLFDDLSDESQTRVNHGWEIDVEHQGDAVEREKSSPSPEQEQPSHSSLLISTQKAVPTPEQKLSALMKKGEQAYQKQDYNRAYPIFKQIVSQQPDNLSAQFYLSYSASNTGQPHEAIASAQKMLDGWYRPAQAYEVLGDSYKQLGELDSARLAYQKAGAEIPRAQKEFLELEERMFLDRFASLAPSTEDESTTSNRENQPTPSNKQASPSKEPKEKTRFKSAKKQASPHSSRRADTTFNQSGQPTKSFNFRGKDIAPTPSVKSASSQDKVASSANFQKSHDNEAPEKTLDVSELTPTEKLTEAVIRAAIALPGETGEKIRAILTPAYLASTVAVLGIYGASHAVGVGQVADVGMLIIGGVYLGKNVFSVINDLIGFAGAIDATTEEELDKAGQHLASAISTVGVNTVVALLTKKAATKIKDGVSSSRVNNPNRLPGNNGGAVTRTGRGEIQPRGNSNNAPPVVAPSIFSVDSEGDNSQIEPSPSVTQQFGEIDNLEPQTVSTLSQLDDTALASLNGSLETVTPELKSEYLNIIASDVDLGQALVEFRTFETPERFLNVFNAIESPGDVATLERVMNEDYLASLGDEMAGRYRRLLNNIADGNPPPVAKYAEPLSFSERLKVLDEVESVKKELIQKTEDAPTAVRKIGQRNIGYGSYDITLPNGETINGNFVSTSGKTSGKGGDLYDYTGETLDDGRTIIPDFPKKRASKFFEATEDRGANDSERKAFEYIMGQIKAKLSEDRISFKRVEEFTERETGIYQGQGFSGNITINSEMTPCDSCENVLAIQFKEYFGNDITVEVNYGVEYKDPLK